MSLRPFTLPATVAVVCVLPYGCASGPKPTDELTRANTVIQQADKTSAQRYAAADLQHAHDELNEAQRLVNEGKNDEARRVAQQAEVDADVAMARGNSGEAQRAAQEVNQGVNTLQEQTQDQERQQTQQPQMQKQTPGEEPPPRRQPSPDQPQ